jgi:hypothetical protein
MKRVRLNLQTLFAKIGLLRLNLQTLFAKIGLRRFSKTRKLNRFCVSAEKNIISQLSKLDSSTNLKEIKTLRLYLRPITNTHYRHYENIKLLLQVLKTRGRLRWLCFRLVPTLFPRSYEYTRLTILLMIFNNWKYFSTRVLSRLRVEETTDQDDLIIDVYEFIHPDIDFEIQNSLTYLLGNEIKQKLEFTSTKRFEIDLHKQLILGKLIRWDSSKVLTYLRERTDFLENPLLVEYLKFFPDFVSDINGARRFSLELHKNAYSSFDDFPNTQKRSHDILNHVEIWHQRFIVEGSKWHIIDSTCTPYSKFVAGHWQFMEQVPDLINHVFIKEPVAEKRKRFTHAIFLMGRADENWYHFLLDTIPRYLFMKNVGAEVPVLVRADIPKTSITFIQRVINRRIVLVNPGDVIAVDNLYFVAARSTVYDSSPPPKVKRVTFSPKTLKRQRKWLLEGVSSKSNSNSLERVFLPRKAKYRNLLNVKQVSRFLESFGFYIPEIGEDFFTRQHIFFSKAGLVVSPGGAILANIIFMKKGSKVIAMRSWKDSKLKIWKSLAEACDVEYREIIGIPTYFGRKVLAKAHANYYIPLILVKRILKH